MFNFLGKPTDVERFKPFSPAEVLYDLDGPRIFTFYNNEEDLYLSYQFDEGFDEGNGWLRYIVVPVNDSIVDALKRGATTLRNALEQPRLWVLNLDSSGDISWARKAEIRALPPDWMPDPKAMLWHALRPFFSVRLIGPGAEDHQTLASVIKTAAQSAEGALKRLAELAQSRRRTMGRPTKELQRYYDLPLQTFGFNSFEISFRHPEPPVDPRLIQEDNEVIDEMSRLLDVGVGIVRGTSTRAELGVMDDEEYRILLDAMKDLTPSTQGTLEEIQVSGSLLNNRGKVESFTPTSRRKVNSEIKAIQPRQQEEVLVETGNIEGADKGKYSFILRNIIGEDMREEIEFTFTSPLYNDVIEAFNDGGRYRVVGLRQKSSGKARALSIEPA